MVGFFLVVEVFGCFFEEIVEGFELIGLEILVGSYLFGYYGIEFGRFCCLFCFGFFWWFCCLCVFVCVFRRGVWCRCLKKCVLKGGYGFCIVLKIVNWCWLWFWVFFCKIVYIGI